jgi:hypothetical protein
MTADWHSPGWPWLLLLLLLVAITRCTGSTDWLTGLKTQAAQQADVDWTYRYLHNVTDSLLCSFETMEQCFQCGAAAVMACIADCTDGMR